MPLLTGAANPLDVLNGSDAGEYVTLPDFTNPLSDDCEWHNLSSFSGILYDGRELSAANIYPNPGNSSLGDVMNSGSVTGSDARSLQAVAFAPAEGGVKDHVAVVGYFRDSGGTHANLLIYAPDGDSLALAERRQLGGSCSFADNAQHTSFTLTVGKNHHFCSVAAGDFNGDGVETLLVYVACDGLDYGLYEFAFTPGSRPSPKRVCIPTTRASTTPSSRS